MDSCIVKYNIHSKFVSSNPTLDFLSTIIDNEIDNQ